MDRYQTLLARIQKEFPRFCVKVRSKTWLHFIFRFLSFVGRRDLSGFTTTIGSTMYVSDDWEKRSPDDRYSTLRHELVHVRQFYQWPLGRWIWPLNHFLMGLCYLLVLPVFLTMRAKFERAGYTQTMLVQRELQNTPLSDEQMESNARWMVATFTGSGGYFWMWTKRATYNWAMETQRLINKGTIINNQDRV